MMNIFQQRISSDYVNTERFVRNMDSSTVTIGINENYLQKANYTEPKQTLLDIAKTLQWIGWIFIVLVNLISYRTRMDLAYGSYFIFGIVALFAAHYLKKQAPKYVLLTQFGENEYVKVGDGSPAFDLIKAHGDLEVGGLKFAPAELTLLSPDLSDEIYRKTSGLTIFVGYRGQDVGLMNSINKTDKASSVYWIDIKVSKVLAICF